MTTEHPTQTITITPAELEHLTGYKQPTQQLNVLHSRGFHRAFMARTGKIQHWRGFPADLIFQRHPEFRHCRLC